MLAHRPVPLSDDTRRTLLRANKHKIARSARAMPPLPRWKEGDRDAPQAGRLRLGRLVCRSHAATARGHITARNALAQEKAAPLPCVPPEVEPYGSNPRHAITTRQRSVARPGEQRQRAVGVRVGVSLPGSMADARSGIQLVAVVCQHGIVSSPPGVRRITRGCRELGGRNAMPSHRPPDFLACPEVHAGTEPENGYSCGFAER